MESEDFVRNYTCCKKWNPPKQHSQLTEPSRHLRILHTTIAEYTDFLETLTGPLPRLTSSWPENQHQQNLK